VPRLPPVYFRRKVIGGLPNSGGIIVRTGTHQIRRGSGAGLRRLDPKTAKHLDGLARGDRSRADRPRRLKPGTVLLREYQGERHIVTVVAKGYVWREATYASLSVIARAITGTAWNGPRFFGLRIDKGTTVSPDAAGAPLGPLDGRHLAGIEEPGHGLPCRRPASLNIC
jgi:hypothetical protein